MEAKKNNYELITETIIQSLERGDIPWNSPYIKRIPQNLFSGKAYRGINTLLLSSVSSQYQAFATFNQFKDNGHSVKKGAKALPLFFFSVIEKKDKKTGEVEDTFPMLKRYSIFRVEDTDCDVSQFLEVNTATPTEIHAKIDRALSMFFAKTLIGLSQCANSAYYSPSNDIVNVPSKENMNSIDEYYTTLFHEIAHASGAENRLNRDLKAFDKDTHSYSFEELVAEMTAAFMCNYFGIASAKQLENSAAYVKSWIKHLSSDVKLAYKAASKAQQACDWILEAMGETTCIFEEQTKAEAA